MSLLLRNGCETVGATVDASVGEDYVGYDEVKLVQAGGVDTVARRLRVTKYDAVLADNLSLWKVRVLRPDNTWS